VRTGWNDVRMLGDRRATLLLTVVDRTPMAPGCSRAGASIAISTRARFAGSGFAASTCASWTTCST
jgi:hypothetical protein